MPWGHREWASSLNVASRRFGNDEQRETRQKAQRSRECIKKGEIVCSLVVGRLVASESTRHGFSMDAGASGSSGGGDGGGRGDGLRAAGVMMIRCRVVRAESVLWWRIPISMNGKKRCALTGWHALTRPLWMEDFSSGLRHELLMPDAFAAAADVAAASRHQQQQRPY